MKIAVYITGHGFGHLTRALAVMKALRRRDASIQFFIRTTAARAFIERELEPPLRIDNVQTDTGGVERNILFSDGVAAIEKAQAFHASVEPLIEREVAFLRSESVDVVLADVPPLASEIAHRAGVPSVSVANFTWDRIYEEYPGSEEIVARLRAWYGKATLGLEVPLGHEATAFPRRERIPLIARKSHAVREEVRRELGLADRDVAVLVGLKGAELDGRKLAAADQIVYFSFASIRGDSVRHLGEEWQARFTDVMVAADVVLSKPGYGIAGECIANRRPLVHLPRFGFAETPFLLSGMEGKIPHEPIALEELETASLTDAIQRLAEMDFQYPEVPVNGADVAADRILALVEREKA